MGTISLKLMIDTEEQKILFAEADRLAADFLFHILGLPLSTVTRLLNKQEMVGSIANLYESIESLGATYNQTNLSKQYLLKPTQPFGNSYSSPLLSILQNHDTLEKGNSACPQPAPPLKATTYGFVNGPATYMVMDDLVVKPLSTAAVLDMLNSRNVGAIEETVVEIGVDEAKNLLKTSLVSKKVLTEVFLKNTINEQDL